MPASQQPLRDAPAKRDDLPHRWLQPLSPLKAAWHRVLYATAWSTVRLAFRFRVEGCEFLPTDSQPVIFAANHESSLDAPLLAAALPYRLLRRTHWAGRRDRLVRGWLTRYFSRVAQAIPIETNVSALEAGAAALARGRNLVWFPEGTRSRDGQLHEFKAGIGVLARQSEIPIVPVCIEGAYEALPPNRKFPRFFSRVAVRFGEPLVPSDFPSAFDEKSTVDERGDFGDVERRLAEELQQRVGQMQGSHEADDSP